MYSDKPERKRGRLRLLILLLCAALALASLLVKDPGRDLGEESAAAIRDTVQRTARQCYVVEGVYPPDLQYLQDNYGLQVNTEDFYVTYEAFASNLPPTVKVAVRKG